MYVVFVKWLVTISIDHKKKKNMNSQRLQWLKHIEPIRAEISRQVN